MIVASSLLKSDFDSLKKQAKQLDLPYVDTDRNAVETRKAALKRQRSPRLLRIVELVRDSRHVGMTRDEISIALDRPVHCICDACQALLKDGQLVETAARRETRCGSPAAVIVHRDFRAEGGAT